MTFKDTAERCSQAFDRDDFPAAKAGGRRSTPPPIGSRYDIKGSKTGPRDETSYDGGRRTSNMRMHLPKPRAPSSPAGRYPRASSQVIRGR